MDYQTICNIKTPKSERRKMNIGDIWDNSAQCLNCMEVIRSKNRHDYVTCSCGNVSVDGGSWYIKRCYGGKGYLDIIEMFEDANDQTTTEENR